MSVAVLFAACSPLSGMAFKLRCKPLPLPDLPEVVAYGGPAPALPCNFQQGLPPHAPTQQCNWPATRLHDAAQPVLYMLPVQALAMPAPAQDTEAPDCDEGCSPPLHWIDGWAAAEQDCALDSPPPPLPAASCTHCYAACWGELSEPSECKAAFGACCWVCGVPGWRAGFGRRG